jgi:hypothetical protein
VISAIVNLRIKVFFSIPAEAGNLTAVPFCIPSFFHSLSCGIFHTVCGIALENSVLGTFVSFSVSSIPDSIYQLLSTLLEVVGISL